MKIAYVAWAPYNRRAESFANEMGAELLLIHYFPYQKPLWSPLKYPLMAIKTMFVLFKNKPNIIFTMTPPLFCTLAVYLYCACSGSELVVDAHTGSLIAVPWIWFRPLHKFLCRKSCVTIVTNDSLADLINSWDAKVLVMNPPIFYPEISFSVLGGFIHLMVINSFSDDEPIEEIIHATRQLTDVQFYITGKLSKAPLKLIQNRPANVHFTGFLPTLDYIRLLKESDGVLCLTTRDHTLLSGGEEALYMGKPLITSEFNILRKYFGDGAVYIKPDQIHIVKGIRKLIKERETLEMKMINQRDRQLQKWKLQKSKLLGLLLNRSN